MKNKDMLRKIYYENRAMNRNIQRLSNIGLIGLLAKSAKASDDQKGKVLVKAGMVFVIITEVLLMVGDIIDCKELKQKLKLRNPNKKIMGENMSKSLDLQVYSR